MQEGGIRLVIVSNALPARARKIAEMAGVPALGMSAKPMPFGFWRAARRMKIRVSEMAVVGDQLLTDIRGGNLCGAVTIFVDPARKEERNVKIFESRRRREQPVLEAFDRLHPTGFYDLDA